MNIDEEINFELAISTLNDLIGLTHNEKREELLKTHPDQDLIARLDAMSNQLWDERDALRSNDSAAVERIITDYCPILKNSVLSNP